MSTTAESAATRASSRAILESLGLDPVINALGPASQLGCATLSSEVRAAMDAAAQHYVPISEMQERASRAIATATGAEAGCVASGGDACLFLAAAACIAGDDPAAMDRLPEVGDLRHEVVVHRAQRNPFDHALRAAGARFVEFGYVGSGSGVGAYRWQLEASINDRTAAIFYVAGPAQANVLPFDVIVEVARARGVPVIVDGAAEDVHGIRDLIARGADLLGTSGGKTIRGPAGSGILAGGRDLIRAATLQQQDMHIHPEIWTPPLRDGCPPILVHEPPHQGIGRSFKVGREEIAGLIVALETLADRDPDAERRRWHSICAKLADAVDGVGGAAAVVATPAAPSYPQTIIQLPSADRALRVVVALAAGKPRVWVNAMGLRDGQMVIVPTELRDDDVPELERRLIAVLSGRV